MAKTFLVTGGVGFVGSAVVRELIKNSGHYVVNVDKLTYASNLESLSSIESNSRYHFVKADIGDAEAMHAVFEVHQPDVVMHLAAESHVDRSIEEPNQFLETNVLGTSVLLEASRRYWKDLKVRSYRKAKGFLFHHVSTDEVYGDREDIEGGFTEESRYFPSSPYAASKASSDHLVRAWHRTYGLPALITNSANNYGPFQHPEKLIPLIISNGLAGKTLPIYGDGFQVRDWIYVEDHARALIKVALGGAAGQSYNIGGKNQTANIDLVRNICDLLDELYPRACSYHEQIAFVRDRPGHDRRYAINAGKIARELKWQPSESLSSGLRKTVNWYLDDFLSRG